jgi:hypothetical protein
MPAFLVPALTSFAQAIEQLTTSVQALSGIDPEQLTALAALVPRVEALEGATPADLTSLYASVAAAQEQLDQLAATVAGLGGGVDAAQLQAVADNVTAAQSAIDALEAINAAARLEALEAVNVAARLTALEGASPAGAVSTPRYEGQTTSQIDLTATTWTALLAALVGGAWSDPIAQGISRAGSTFTAAEAGSYYFHASVSQYQGSGAAYLQLRLRRADGTTALQRNGYAVVGQLTDFQLSGVVELAAGESVTLQYVGGSGFSVSPGTTDGEPRINARVTLFRLAGAPVESAPAVPAVCAYRGALFSPEVLSYSANQAWNDFFSAISSGTWTDEVQLNITRAASALTVSQAGWYRIDWYTPSHTGGTPPLLGGRLKVNGVVKLSTIGYGGSGSGTTSEIRLSQNLLLAAGDVLTFEYCNWQGATGFTITDGQIAGANIKIASIDVFRLAAA